MNYRVLLPFLCGLAPVLPVNSHDIGRFEGPNVAVANSVTVPAGSDLIFVSGIIADAADKSAPAGSADRFGDTATQLNNVLVKLDGQLQANGLSLSDVVKMNIYLVADPRRQGAVDHSGLLAAYTSHFGTTQGDWPARTTLQVAGLRMPGILVEVEAVVAHTPEH